MNWSENLLTLNNIHLERKMIIFREMGTGYSSCKIFFYLSSPSLKVRLIIHDSEGCNVNNKNII